MPQSAAIGKAVIALSVIALVLAATLGVVIVALRSIIHTTTTTITATALDTTTTAMLGAVSQCGFTTTCAAMSASGLELIAAVNSTAVRPNDTLTISVTELNTLPTTNDVSSSSGWRLGMLTWPLGGCGSTVGGGGYVAHTLLVFKGYYVLSNLTAPSLNLDDHWFWAAASCPNDPFGQMGYVTSYLFQPHSDNASLLTSNKVYRPAHMFYGIGVIPGAINNIGKQTFTLIPSTYTLVAGDEWGTLVLLHFTVT